MLMAAKPEGAAPVLHSDTGWQHRHASYVARLRENGFVQSMSRKGNCIDNGATVFGHIKDEFFRGRDWSDFESFKRDLEAYIQHWNHARRQVRPSGRQPSGYYLSRPSFGAQFIGDPGRRSLARGGRAEARGATSPRSRARCPSVRAARTSTLHHHP